MQITKTDRDQITVLAIQGQLDATTAPQLDAALQAQTQTEAKRFIVDLEQVQLISSAALRVLLSAAKQMKKQQGQILLCALTPEVQKVFEISGLTSLFTLYPSQSEALASLGIVETAPPAPAPPIAAPAPILPLAPAPAPAPPPPPPILLKETPPPAASASAPPPPPLILPSPAAPVSAPPPILLSKAAPLSTPSAPPPPAPPIPVAAPASAPPPILSKAAPPSTPGAPPPPPAATPASAPPVLAKATTPSMASAPPPPPPAAPASSTPPPAAAAPAPVAPKETPLAAYTPVPLRPASAASLAKSPAAASPAPHASSAAAPPPPPVAAPIGPVASSAPPVRPPPPPPAPIAQPIRPPTPKPGNPMLIVGIVAAVVLLGLVGCFFLYRAFFSGKPTNGPVAKPTPIVEPTPDASTPAPTPFDNEPIVASSTPAAGELPAGAVQAPAKVSFDANNAENQDTRKAVLERVDLMPFPKATKDRLYKAVDTARSMGKIATIGFSTGQSAPSPAAVASLKQTFQRPDIQTLLTNPAAVVVVLGFADATGTAKKNKEASEQRAEKTLAALRDSLGLLNVMHSVGMGGSEFLGKGNLEKNRVAEIWIVIP